MIKQMKTRVTIGDDTSVIELEPETTFEQAVVEAIWERDLAAIVSRDGDMIRVELTQEVVRKKKEKAE